MWIAIHFSVDRSLDRGNIHFRRIAICAQRKSPGRVPTRMRGEDMQRAAPPALTEESGPLVGTSKDGAGHRWRDGRPLDRNTGTGPAVMILPWNIIELALGFHGDSLAGPLSRDWPLVSAFLAQRRRSHVEPHPHHADD